MTKIELKGEENLVFIIDPYGNMRDIYITCGNTRDNASILRCSRKIWANTYLQYLVIILFYEVSFSVRVHSLKNSYSDLLVIRLLLCGWNNTDIYDYYVFVALTAVR